MSEQRLIDANRLIDFIDCGHLRNPLELCFSESEVVNMLDSAPTIPAVDVAPVVRCVECIWWQDRQVQLIDGSCRDYMPDEPWSVTCDVGINVGSHCTKHGFDDESGSWFWAAANDYCSCGKRKGTMTK